MSFVSHTIFRSMSTALALASLSACGGPPAAEPDGGSDGGPPGRADAAADGGLDGSVASDAGPSLAMCTEECTVDADCRLGGEDRNYACDPVSRRCRMLPCDERACRALRNMWTTACASDADCAGEPVPSTCVDDGVCAPTWSGSCPSGQRAFEVARHPSGETAQVCGTPTRCFQTTCFPDCTFAGCAPNFACDEATGQCGCASDAACTIPGYRCNLELGQCCCHSPTSCPEGRTCREGRCLCADDSDCEGRGICDVASGECICADASDCSSRFDGTRAVCE